jgi:O-antigen/teichoic acid export membrane protein
VKRIYGNLISVIGGEAVVRTANLSAVLVIARLYGAFALGAYAACLAVVTVVVMFADNGLQTSAIADLSAAGSEPSKIMGQLYLSKTILIFAALLALGGIAYYMKFGFFVLAIGGWVTLRTVLQSFSQLQIAALKALAKVNGIGVIQLIHALLLFIGVWMTHRLGWGIFALLAWLSMGQVSELFLMGLALRRSGLRAVWPVSGFFWKSMRRSTPFGITSGLANLILRGDTVVLSTIVSLPELGTFSAANTIIAVVYAASWIFGSILLAEMVRLTPSTEGLKAYVRKWTRVIVVTTTPCALVLFWTGPKLITLFYGPGFHRSGVLASVMALACPLILLNSLYTNLAFATGSKCTFLGLFAVTAAAAIGLDLLFGHALGSMGVAVAIVIREMGMQAGFRILMSRALSPARPLGYSVSSS